MSRITPRWKPRVVVHGAPSVETPAFYQDWMASQLEEGAYLKPGSVFNALWLEIGEEIDFDGQPGQPHKLKALALCCDYEIAFRNTSASLWTRTRSKSETLAVNYALTKTAERIDAIKEDLKAENAPKGAEKEKLENDLAEQEAIFRQLKSGTGFLESAPGALGTGVTGINWRLMVANVPVEMTEMFPLHQDRSLSFRLNRAQAPEEQASFDFEVEIEAGYTCYGMRMGADGNSTEWRHYRSMSRKKRLELRAKWKQLLDKGRVTVEEQLEILRLERQSRAIDRAVKERAKADKKAEITAEETATLKSIDEQIERIKDKTLTSRDNADLAQVESDLFLARESFQLQESASSLIGQDVDVTIQFLRSGHVVVRSGAHHFRYENKALTSLPTPFNRALPAGAKLTIRSDGGQWVFVPGSAKWKPCRIRTQPWESDHGFGSDVRWIVVGDAIGDCEIRHTIIQLRAPTEEQAGLYQMELQLATNGRYTPELYYIGLHRPASDGEEGDVLWDSDDGANFSPAGVPRVTDVLLQDDKRRARLAQCVLNDAGASHLPSSLVGCACDVIFKDRWDGGAQTSVLRHGYVGAGERGRVGRIETQSGFAHVNLAGGEAVLSVVGPEMFLNRPVEAPVPGDGQFPNDYVRILMRDCGLPSAWWERIPAGDAGFPHIPPTKAGGYPSAKPAARTTYLETIRDTVKKHCPRAEMWSDALGFILNGVSNRDQRGRGQYGVPATGVPVSSPRCLRGLAGFKLVQDVRNYVTLVSAIGKRDERTGRRWNKTETIPQAADKQFENSVYYVGHHIPEIIMDDTLDSEAKCLLAAREKLGISSLTPDGLAPVWIETHLDLDPTLLTGDLLNIFGLQWVMDSTEFGALNAGAEGQRMSVSFQLAQDASRAQLESLTP